MKKQGFTNLRLTLALVLLSVTGNPAVAQPGEESEQAGPVSAPSVLGMSFGFTTLKMEDWKTSLEELEQTIEDVNRTNYPNNGPLIDLFLKVRVHPQMSVGFQFQSLTNRMTIEYSDYSNLGLMQIFLLQGEKVLKLKTNTILLMPGLCWYIPDGLPDFYPFLEAGFGVGTTKVRMEENMVTGQGQGFAFSGAAGLEAGGKVLLFHLRAGYRYYDPSMKFLKTLDKDRNPGANQSGFFASIGIGFRLN